MYTWTGSGTPPTGGSGFTWEEQHLYGSSRLGIWTPKITVPATLNPTTDAVQIGSKLFELTNHLDNVMVTISDRQIQPSSGGATVDYYEPQVISAVDYTPFGMQMVGRSYTVASYRYEFNGKENDDEVKGGFGNQQDYGMRIYDPRLGRFLSVDPLTSSYPWYTPYQFAGNKPIWATDLDGLEENTRSTYVYHPPVLSLKLAFNGIISITDARNQSAHKTFEGNYAQLRKGDRTGVGPVIVNQIVSSNTAVGQSLDLQIIGSRTEIAKSWKSTDKKYIQQYSYTFSYLNDDG